MVLAQKPSPVCGTVGLSYSIVKSVVQCNNNYKASKALNLTNSLQLKTRVELLLFTKTDNAAIEQY